MIIYRFCGFQCNTTELFKTRKLTVRVPHVCLLIRTGPVKFRKCRAREVRWNHPQFVRLNAKLIRKGLMSNEVSVSFQTLSYNRCSMKLLVFYHRQLSSRRSFYLFDFSSFTTNLSLFRNPKSLFTTKMRQRTPNNTFSVPERNIANSISPRYSDHQVTHSHTISLPPQNLTTSKHNMGNHGYPKPPPPKCPNCRQRCYWSSLMQAWMCYNCS